MGDKLFAIGKIASNCITTAKIADDCLSGSGVFRTVVDKTKNKNQKMQVTDKETLIITIDGKTRLLTKEEIVNAFREKTQYQKNMEAVQKDWDERLRQNNCANYERDNNLSEIEENVKNAINNSVNTRFLEKPTEEVDKKLKEAKEILDKYITTETYKKYEKEINSQLPKEFFHKKTWKEEVIEQEIENFIENNSTSCQDLIVESVRQKLLDRSNVGLKKYNSSIFDNIDENYIKHLQEELLDGANYCEQVLRLGEFTKTIIEILQSDQNEMSVGNKIIREYNKLKYGNII